jgi:hypothetical protein
MPSTRGDFLKIEGIIPFLSFRLGIIPMATIIRASLIWMFLLIYWDNSTEDSALINAYIIPAMPDLRDLRTGQLLNSPNDIREKPRQPSR